MSTHFKLVVLLFIFFSAPLWAQTYKLDSSAVRFEIKNAGLTVDGLFNAPEMEMTLSDGNLTTMKLSGTVETASINTGIGLRDKHLRDEKYFHVEKYPVIRMELLNLKKIDEQQLKGSFRLSMKGTTKEVPVMITIEESQTQLRLTGTFELNRRDFKVGSNSLLLSDEVNITVMAVFVTRK